MDSDRPRLTFPLGLVSLLVVVSSLFSTAIAQVDSPRPSTWRVVVGDKAVPGEILVRFRTGVANAHMQSLHAAAGARVVSESRLVKGLSRVRLTPGTRLRSSLQRYRSDPSVLYAEPNYVVHVADTNDPQFALQWNLANTGQGGGTAGADIHAMQAWAISTGSPNVAVGVIDTGVDYRHSDLDANVWTAAQAFSVQTPNGTITCPAGTRGFNSVAWSCDPLDDYGHGTNVSGIIGAIGNNGVGVAGLNWKVQIIPCKFLDANGSGDVSGAVACLDWMHSLKAAGVPIIATNNSWSGGYKSQALIDAIAAQAADGILFVTAAGNDFSDNDVAVDIPASIFSSNVISVAASTNNDMFAAFSNVGIHSVHITAPGQEILSTFPGNSYARMSGTSQAAPQVTGLAALLKAANPSLDWRSIRNLILSGGDPAPSLQQTVTARRLNAYGSLTCAGSTVQKRLQPTLDAIPAAAGQPITLAAINVNCGNPAGTVQATVHPGGQIITLRDNGQSPDQSNADGIYTGQFTPADVNNYTITFPWGDPVQVVVLKNYLAGQVPYEYRSIAGTNLNLRDDSVGTIQVPFAIHYGGATFNTLYVSSNGTLSVTNAFGDFVPERLPVDAIEMMNPQNPPPPLLFQPVVTLLAPWWQDLNPLPNTAHNVFWAVNGTAPNREMVIEWRDVPAFECATDLTSTIKFQVVLSESNDNVLFNYADARFGGQCASADFGSEAEIGVQVSQTVATEWGLDLFITPGNASINDGMSIQWSIPAANAPPNPVPTVSSMSPNPLTMGSGDTIVTLTGTNFVPNSQVEVYPVFSHPTIYVSPTTLKFLLTAQDLAYPTYLTQLNVYNPPPGGGYSDAIYYNVTQPAPQITSISPMSAPAGSFGFILTIKGTNLQYSGDVMFDDGKEPAALQIVTNTASQISAVVPEYLLRTPGTFSIYVFNGAVSSNKVSFTVSAAPGAIAGSPQNGGSTLSAITMALPFPGWKEASRRGSAYMKRFLRPRADLAHDTPPVPIGGFSGPLVQGSGSTPLAPPGFSFRPTVPADFLPTAVVSGDFNRDGHMDWAISNAGSNNIWIYPGKGDGSSQVPTIVKLSGYSPVAMAAADMNGDGKLDLVVAEADSLSVVVLLGNGDGTFQQERRTFVPGAPLSIAVADFDGDGDLDVVAGLVIGVEGTPLAFLPGDGKGNLGLPAFHFGGSYFAETIALAAADLNHDGLPDLVAVQLQFGMDGVLLGTQFAGAGAHVYLNAGKGSFKLLQIADPDATQDQIGYFGHAVTSVALADVNRDGCVDLVAVDHVGLADFLPGLCNGSFDTANRKTFGAGVPGAAATLADLNADGKLDLVVGGFHFNDNSFGGTSAGDAVSVLLGHGDGTFGAPTLFRGEPSMNSVAIADLNGDGKPDIVTANESTDSASIYLNNGNGGFGIPTGGYAGYLSSNRVHGANNAPMTNFAYADVNGDGKSDLVFFQYPFVAYDATQLTVLLGDGHGQFGSPLYSSVLYNMDTVQDFVVGDFRNTGRPDILVLNYNPLPPVSWALALLKNNGDGSFQKATFPVNNADNLWPVTVLAADFNKDGKLDVIVFSYATNGVSIVPFLGQGDGTFLEGTPIPFPASTLLLNPIVGDFDQDGNIDLLLLKNGALTLIPGKGDGTFGAQRTLISNFNYFAAADLNGDGIPDLVEVVQTGTSVYEPAPLEYAVYLGKKGGTFQSFGTYGPYPGLFTRNFLGSGLDDPVHVDRPFLGDFNGDGRLDIAAYQTSITGQFIEAGVFESGPGNTDLRFLLGNGDGTFAPSYISYPMNRYYVPQLVADVNGDSRSDLVQFDWITSSYHVIPGAPGPSFGIGMVSNPIVGGQGTARVTLALPSAAGTTVQLSASDPNIALPTSVNIPAGAFDIDVPFQIAASFNAAHVLAITAKLGSESHTAFGTEASSQSNLGFVGALGYPNIVVLASQTTPDLGLTLASLNGYATEVTLSCEGLPAGSTCQFGNNPADLGAGTLLITTLEVTTSANVAVGTYPFKVTIKDATFTLQLPATLSIGDFSVSAPANQVLLSNGTLNQISITVNGINGFNGQITISCNTGLPPGLTCPFQGAQVYPVGNYPTYVQTQNVPAGVYQWTITGTVGTISHSSTVPLYIAAKQPSVTGSIGPDRATVAVGSSADFTVTLQSQDDALGPFTLGCMSPPSGITCSFSPNPLNLVANGSATGTLTVKVTAKPFKASMVPQSRRSSLGGMLLLPGLLAVLFFGAPTSAKRRVCEFPGVWWFRMLLLGFVLAVLSSCGDGSSSSGGPPVTPPPPQPTNVILNIQTSGPGVNTVLGSITVSIPN